MADQNGNGATPDAGQQGPQQRFQIAKIYLSDVSFESPGTPQSFRSEWRPQVDVEIGSQHRSIGESTFDCVLTVTVTAKNDDQVAYLCEVKQAGVFRVEGFAEGEIGHVLGAYCPAQLFPFAREAINDLVVKGGFPQLLLAPVNFDVLYAQQLQQQRPAASNGNDSASRDPGTPQE